MSKINKSDTKKKKGLVRKFFGSFFNVRKWVSYDELVTNTENALGFFKKFFSRPKKEQIKESYEKAIARMALNENQLTERKKVLLKSAMIYFAVALLMTIYFIHLILSYRFLAACLTLGIITPVSLIGYREHFWYMQMEKKKLGCTFKDWLDFVLRRNAK